MASMWRKAMLYLGLGPDDEYDDYDVGGEDHHSAPARPAAPRRSAPVASYDHDPIGSVRTLTPSPVEDDERGRAFGINGGAIGRVEYQGTPAPVPAPSDRGGAERATVREITTVSRPKPYVVGPKGFNDAQDIGDKYKSNVPVILNLQGVERDLSRRIIDFASGLCYGLDGQMERVANQVYLLTPSDVEVSDEDRRRLHERGYEA